MVCCWVDHIRPKMWPLNWEWSSKRREAWNETSNPWSNYHLRNLNCSMVPLGRNKVVYGDVSCVFLYVWCIFEFAFFGFYGACGPKRFVWGPWGFSSISHYQMVSNPREYHRFVHVRTRLYHRLVGQYVDTTVSGAVTRCGSCGLMLTLEKKALGCWIGVVPFKYQMMTIGDVPHPN